MNTTYRHIGLMLSIALIRAEAQGGKPVSIEMKYEGGSLPLNDSKLKVQPGAREILIVQGKQRILISTSSVTEISYGNDVHRRVGAAVGVGVVTLGVGALLALTKTKKHYVGITWEGNQQAEFARGGAIFKVGKGEYRGFIAALEGVTGKKAVDADNHAVSSRSESPRPAAAPQELRPPAPERLKPSPAPQPVARPEGRADSRCGNGWCPDTTAAARGTAASHAK